MELGRYTVKQQMEIGPFGPVYSALSPPQSTSEGLSEAGGPVLIHVLQSCRSAESRDAKQLASRLTDLARRQASGLVLPSQVGVHENNIPFLVSPLPQGECLTLAAAQGVSQEEMLLVLRGTARVLARAQQRGIAHLALTPGSIFVGRSGGEFQVTLAAVGLASWLGVDRSQGWPEALRGYSAPEQRGSQGAISPRADVYALGALALSLHLGAPPGLDPAPALRGTVGMPRGLRELVERMLDPKPEGRPEMTAVAAALEQIIQRSSLTGLPVLPAAQASGKVSAVIAPSLPQANADPLIGQTLGNFRVIRKIGEGGMGVVYEALHTQIGRRAAVKILRSELAQSPEYAARFINEARAVNIVAHPGLVEIFEAGQRPDGSLYFIMEFLEGTSLSELNDGRKGQSAAVQDAIEIGVQASHALALAHARGIVHRDLKPENIMLVPDPNLPRSGRVKILDFGIAKVRPTRGLPQTGDEVELAEQTEVRTQIGQVIGTPLYMSPEQFCGAEEVTGKGDVFSLGVILYEMLAGGLPYAESPLGSLVLSERPAAPLIRRNPEVPQPLAALIHRMLAAEPAERPSMHEVAESLQRLRPQDSVRRSRLGALVGAGVTLLLGGLVFLAMQLLKPTDLPALRRPALALIQQGLRSSDPNLRQASLQAIARSRDLSHRLMVEQLLRDPSQQVVAEAALALGEIGAVESYRALLSTESANAPAELMLALGGALAQLHHPQGFKILRRLVNGTDPAVQVQATARLLQYGDFSGAPLLRERLARLTPNEPALIQALGRLASAGDDDAKQRLTMQLHSATSSVARAYISWTLSRLGDDEARAQLVQMAQRPGPDQLLAARLLASLGEPAGYPLFIEQAVSRQAEEATREIALEGLADCRKREAAPTLAGLLDVNEPSERVRLAAASTVLQLLASDRAVLAQQSLNWARAALSSDSTAARQLAVAMLGEMDDEQAIAPLREALKDAERDIRAGAARALGRKHGRTALQALLVSLDDKEAEVRITALRAIRTVVTQLVRGGAQAQLAELLAQLRNLHPMAGELERTLVSGILLAIGDGSQQGPLRAALGSKDSRVRALAAELAPSDLASLTAALADPVAGVRLAAAQRLAELGSRAGVSILREAASTDDEEGLRAYLLLRRLGEEAALPPGLASMLTMAEQSVRMELLDAIAELPEQLRLRFLALAAIDSSPAVRRRVGQVASDLFQKTRRLAYLNIVRNLAHDPDVGVREGAVGRLAVLEQITPDLSVGAVASAPQKQATATGGPQGATTSSSSFLRLIGEELVSVRIDNGKPMPLPDRPVPIMQGHHVVSYLGGTKEVDVPAGSTITVQIPVTLAEQYLSDTKSALQNKEYDRAQQLLNRIRTLLDRGRASAVLRLDLHYYQARVHEGRNRLDQALHEYNLLLESPGAARRPDLLTPSQKSVGKLTSGFGRVQIFTQVDGKCRLTSEMLKPPGEHLISIGGMTKQVWTQAGVPTKVSFCP